MAGVGRDGGIIIAAATTKAYNAIAQIIGNQFGKCFHAPTMAKAKQRLAMHREQMLIIHVPLSDEPGVEAAASIAAHDPCVAILLIVPGDEYAHIRYQIKDSGVMIMAKPITTKGLYETVGLMYSSQKKVAMLSEENRRLRARLAEINTVNRAKCMLIEHRGLKESEAHRYLEKQAMDLSLTKVEVAKNIIAMYEI